MHVLFFSACALLVGAFGAHLPDNLHTCSRSEPDFNECLRSSIEDAIHKLANGNTQLGIIPLEPLQIELIGVDRVPGSSVSIDQKFSNIKLHGLSQSKINKVVLDMEKDNVLVEAFTPVLRSEADFEITGQLLIFPINGKGPSNVTMTNLRSIHNITGERFHKKGKEYVRVVSYKISVIPENINYQFHNVLGGERSARISEEVHKVINENAISVFNEVRPATEHSYGLIFQQIANRIFTKVPLNEIYRD